MPDLASSTSYRLTNLYASFLRFNNRRLLDRAHPLWDLTLFNRLRGQSLVLWEMHHAIVDGVPGFDLLNKTMDFRRNPRPVKPPSKPWSPARLPSSTEAYIRAVRDLIVQQVDAVTRNLRDFLESPPEVFRTGQSALTDSNRLLGETGQTLAVATPWNSGLSPRSELQPG